MYRLSFLTIVLLILAVEATLSLGCGESSNDDDDSGADSDDDDDDDNDDDNDDDDDDNDDNDDDDDDNDDDDDDDDDDDPPPYPVGNKTFYFSDPSRWDPATQGPRSLVTEVWYPTTDESAELPKDILMNFFSPWEDEVIEIFLANGLTEDDIPLLYQETGSVRDAPLRQRNQPYPLVVFSHGNGSVRFQNFTLCEYFAGQGFIVVSPNHTGNSLAAPFPDQLVNFDPELAYVSYFLRPGDVSFLIDLFIGEVDNSEIVEYVNLVDAEKIAVGGMSFGSITSSEAIKKDDRIKAAFLFAFPMLPWGMHHVHVPTLHAWGQEDRTIGDVNFMIEFGYAISPSPKYNLSFISAGHYSFSDLCRVAPSVAGFQDGCGDGIRRETNEPFTFTEHAIMSEILNNYVTAFLNVTFFEDIEAQTYLDENHYPVEMDYTYDR